MGRRIARTYCLPPGAIFHSMWRALNGAFFLRWNWVKTLYLTCLAVFLKRAKGNVAWHSFCIMDNHGHKAATLREGSEWYSKWMRSAHSSFGLLFNQRRKRRGPVAEGRPKTVVIEDQEGLKRTMFYGDYNPVAADIVKHPKDYKWSSYRFYAYGETSPWTKHLTRPQWYEELGDTDEVRQRRYRELAAEYWRKKLLPKEALIDEGFAYGTSEYVRKSSRFMAAVARHVRKRTFKRRDLAHLVGRVFEGLASEVNSWAEPCASGSTPEVPET